MTGVARAARAACRHALSAAAVICVAVACGNGTPSGRGAVDGAIDGDGPAAGSGDGGDGDVAVTPDAEDLGRSNDLDDGAAERDDGDAATDLDEAVDGDGGSGDTAFDAAADGGSSDTPVDGSSPDAPIRCERRLPLAPAAELPDDATWVEAHFTPCAVAAHPLVVSGETTWLVEAEGVPQDARLFVYEAAYARSPLAPPRDLARADFAGASGRLEVRFTAPRAGEFFAVVERDDLAHDAPYRIRLTCVDRCGLEATRYPIVLVHGYAGVDSYFGVLDYFYDVVATLGEAGFSAHTPVTDAIATSVDRASQLAPQIDAILAETGAARVNIVAHSQGGLDARYLVSTLGYGDRVASITTVATPHHGIGAVLFDFLSAQSFDPDDVEAFNVANPDDPRVRYWSWRARSCGALDFGCRDASGGESIEFFLVATHTLLLRFGENDGIVPTASMTWGEDLGLLFADHFDEVGQIADGTSEGDPFDHRAFYLAEARRLRSAGL